MGGKRTRPNKEVDVQATKNEPPRKRVAKTTAKTSEDEQDELRSTFPADPSVEDVEDAEDDDSDLEGFVDDYPGSDTEDLEDLELDGENNSSSVENAPAQEPSQFVVQPFL